MTIFTCAAPWVHLFRAGASGLGGGGFAVYPPEACSVCSGGPFSCSGIPCGEGGGLALPMDTPCHFELFIAGFRDRNLVCVHRQLATIGAAGPHVAAVQDVSLEIAAALAVTRLDCACKPCCPHCGRKHFAPVGGRLLSGAAELLRSILTGQASQPTPHVLMFPTTCPHVPNHKPLCSRPHAHMFPTTYPYVPDHIVKLAENPHKTSAYVLDNIRACSRPHALMFSTTCPYVPDHMCHPTYPHVPPDIATCALGI